MRSREPALSEVEGDPMPVDIQQWPDRESSEILGPRLSGGAESNYVSTAPFRAAGAPQ